MGRSAESIFCINQILTAIILYIIRKHLLDTVDVNLRIFIAYLLPGHVDPPWWGSGGPGKQQGEACVAVCWCGCTVWTHLKKPVGDVGRKSDDGSSHPGPGNWTVQVCLVSPNGVSLVGWNKHRKIRNNVNTAAQQVSTDFQWLSRRNSKNLTFIYFLNSHLLQKKKTNEYNTFSVWGDTGFYLLLRCTGALQGSPRNLLGFKGAVGGSLFTAISHGRIGDVVQTSHTLGKENRTQGAVVCYLWLS